MATEMPLTTKYVNKCAESHKIVTNRCFSFYGLISEAMALVLSVLYLQWNEKMKMIFPSVMVRWLVLDLPNITRKCSLCFSAKLWDAGNDACAGCRVEVAQRNAWMSFSTKTINWQKRWCDAGYVTWRDANIGERTAKSALMDDTSSAERTLSVE